MPGGSEREVVRLFRLGLERLDIDIDEAAAARLTRYCLELIKWNKKINLVARNTSIRDMVDKHFLDSLVLIPIIDGSPPQDKSLLDVGSGAGFPGLVLKAVRPAMRITLLEPRERRSAFLRHIIRILDLKNIQVVVARIEGGELPESNYGVITGRAVANVPNFLDMVAGCASRQSLVICMQGAGGKENVQEGQRVSGFICVGVESTQLPFSGAQRFILLFRKEQ